MGGLWQIGGLRKEIEASDCGYGGYGGYGDEMRCLICSWLQVYGSDRGGTGKGLRKNMGMADHCSGRGLLRKKKMGMVDHCERERQSLQFFLLVLFFLLLGFIFFFLVLFCFFKILC